MDLHLRPYFVYASSEDSGESAKTPAPLLLDYKICTKIAWFCSSNPFMPNGISHRYQLEQSISVLRVVGWYFFILFKFY